MTTPYHALSVVRRCTHDKQSVYVRTGPVGEPIRERRCEDCGRTLDIREVSANG